MLYNNLWLFLQRCTWSTSLPRSSSFLLHLDHLFHNFMVKSRMEHQVENPSSPGHTILLLSFLFHSLFFSFRLFLQSCGKIGAAPGRDWMLLKGDDIDGPGSPTYHSFWKFIMQLYDLYIYHIFLSSISCSRFTHLPFILKIHHKIIQFIYSIIYFFVEPIMFHAHQHPIFSTKKNHLIEYWNVRIKC